MARWMQSEVKFGIWNDYVLSRCGFVPKVCFFWVAVGNRKERRVPTRLSYSRYTRLTC